MRPRVVWVAGAIALLGLALTTLGTLAGVPGLNAPGATAIVVGAGWLGVLAAGRFGDSRKD